MLQLFYFSKLKLSTGVISLLNTYKYRHKKYLKQKAKLMNAAEILFL